MSESGEAPMNEITYKPIEIVRSPFKDATGTLTQSVVPRGAQGIVEIDAKSADKLRDVDGRTSS
jgi:tRNA (Thr-GGU) A37 N-methylase